MVQSIPIPWTSTCDRTIWISQNRSYSSKTPSECESLPLVARPAFSGEGWGGHCEVAGIGSRAGLAPGAGHRWHYKVACWVDWCWRADYSPAQGYINWVKPLVPSVWTPSPSCDLLPHWAVLSQPGELDSQYGANWSSGATGFDYDWKGRSSGEIRAAISGNFCLCDDSLEITQEFSEESRPIAQVLKPQRSDLLIQDALAGQFLRNLCCRRQGSLQITCLGAMPTVPHCWKAASAPQREYRAPDFLGILLWV